MKIVACYIRVSPEVKNQAGQRREINQWLKSNRINPKTVRWYIDKSNSDSLSRRGFEKLQANISNREVGTVVIWRLDRLSPTMRDGLSILRDWAKTPLRIVILNEMPLNATGKVDRVILKRMAERAICGKCNKSARIAARIEAKSGLRSQQPIR